MESVPLPIFSEVKAAAQKPKGWSYLLLGFRPFYLGGTLMAAMLTADAWIAAFLIYLWVYSPWLMQTRLDGKDG